MKIDSKDLVCGRIAIVQNGVTKSVAKILPRQISSLDDSFDSLQEYIEVLEARIKQLEDSFIEHVLLGGGVDEILSKQEREDRNKENI